MHAQLEKYLQGGEFDYSTEETRRVSEIALSGCAHLPQPNTPGMFLEQHFAFELPSTPGLTYQGFIDVLLTDSAAVPDLEGGVPAVMDHKSTSNFRYAKTKEDLKTDPQAVIYAYHAMTAFKAAAVDLKWVYYRTTGTNASKEVHLRVFSKDVVEEFQKINSTSQDMVAMYTAKVDPLSLPASLDACDAYGGCPYKRQCTDLHCGPLGHLTEEETRNMTQSGQDLFAKLQAANNEAPPPVAQALPPMVQLPFPVPVQAVPTVQAPVVAINPPESLLPTPPPVVEEPKSKKTKAAAKPKAPEGYTLFVDCAPVTDNADVVDATSFFAKAKEKITTELGVSDYRLVDYGKGQGAFVAAVGFFVDQEKVSGIILDSRTPEGLLVLSDLTSKAANVVRGYR